MLNATKIDDNFGTISNNVTEFASRIENNNNSTTQEEELAMVHVIPIPTELRMDEIYVSVYVTWMYLGFMYVLPFGGLSVLNLLIYLDVRKVLEVVGEKT